MSKSKNFDTTTYEKHMINFDDLDDDTELENFELDQKSILEKLPEYTSHKLCSMIVCDRYFGCYKDIAIACMGELANRRLAGDNFEYETYIEKEFSKLPKLDFSIPDLGDVLRQAIGKGTNHT